MKFTWDETTGVAKCILKYNNNEFIGQAKCHPEDLDMKSKKGGELIATTRAKIKYLTHIKENELKPSLHSLKQLYYSMNKSKYFNPKSYENKMLQRQIKMYELDIIAINDVIKINKNELRNYIENKELLYQKIRKHRQVNPK